MLEKEGRVPRGGGVKHTCTYIISKFKERRVLNSDQERDRKRTTIAKRTERFRRVQYTIFSHPKGPLVQMPCAPGVLLYCGGM